MKKILVAVALMAVFSLHSTIGYAQRFDARDFRYSGPNANWVDSVMNTLTLEQRIAQLMVVRVPLDMDDQQAREFSEKMNGYGVGGVCFFVGTAERQVAMTRRFQSDARVPLLVCIDGEWGLGMRLKDMYSFPKNAEFGKLPPEADSIVYRMGVEVGRQCREMGIHINFAPVVDINSNPKNPVIGVRSYGTDRERVAQLGIMFALGQQSQGVMATAKHFPGHGDTDADSHLELPVINHPRAYVDTVDMYPFKQLIDAGVGGVMVAHLQVNAYDRQHPSSLSRTIVTDILKERLGFKGLVITDGLDMKGVTDKYSNGEGELAALLAGNDILLLPPDVKKAIAVIKAKALEDEDLRRSIDEHCRRVLEAKHKYVVPQMKQEIKVPGEEHKQACHDIVADLYLNITKEIDSVVNYAIDKQAMPGCEIVVMHQGRMVFDRAYGHLTYDGYNDVTTQTVYDLASLTKPLATTLAVMRLVEEETIGLDDKLSKYLPYLKKTDKSKITVRQALSHQTRLKAFDNYWQQTSSRDSVLLLAAQSKLNDKCVYSDLNFMLLADMVERVTGKPLDQYVRENFYEPMGLRHTAFNPIYNGVNITQIAPTEQDSLRGLIRGFVHDPNAHAMGGVSGHAGLFSTAEEVAQLLQMLLDGGVYQGRRYLSEATVKMFTSRHFEAQGNRRALGFDKQLLQPSRNAQVCMEASQASYGHTGFTGTMFWVDPEYDLVYVFLSNRTYPSSAENKLAKLNIRTDIQSIIYSFFKR